MTTHETMNRFIISHPVATLELEKMSTSDMRDCPFGGPHAVVRVLASKNIYPTLNELRELHTWLGSFIERLDGNVPVPWSAVKCAQSTLRASISRRATLGPGDLDLDARLREQEALQVITDALDAKSKGRPPALAAWEAAE